VFKWTSRLNWSIVVIALLVWLLTVLEIGSSALKATSGTSRCILGESLRRKEIKSMLKLKEQREANGLSNYDVK
jgi:hypothetical protein